MPEMPEVAHLCTQLNKALSGMQITKIKILGGKYERHGPPKGFEWASNIIKTKPTIQRIFPKGKHLVFELQNRNITPEGPIVMMVSHLAMTGKWGFSKGKHTHILVRLLDEDGDKFKLYYSDLRCFGSLTFYDGDGEEYRDFCKRIGKSFLGCEEDRITKQEFINNLGKCRGESYLATCLMDQKRVCSGIGNYILSEVLYRARINPWIKIKDVTEEMKEKLFKACKKVFLGAFEKGGNSIQDYLDLYGKVGQYQFKLCVYGKKTDKKGNQVEKQTGPHKRTIHWVPKLQKQPI